MHQFSPKGLLNLTFKVYFALVFFLALLIFYPLLYFLLANRKRHHNAFRLMKIISYVIQMFTFSFAWKNKKIKADHPQIICSNHSSYLDIILMYAVYNRPFLFLGKSELLNWPVVNIFFKKMNIAINRNNKRAAVKALAEGRQRLHEGWSIVIFPEGTIPHEVPKLDRFKSGAFKLALEEKIPIQPITFLNHWSIISEPTDIWGSAKPGLGLAIIHDEIEVAQRNEKDLISLRDEVFDVINKPNVAYNQSAIEKYNKD